MLPARVLWTIPALVCVLVSTAPARAEHALVPEGLVALDTAEGEKLLVEASARADFFRLVDSFVTQDRPPFCGVASAVMVLNALPVPAPATEVGRQFTQQNFFGEGARKIYPSESVSRGGMTLGQLADLLQTHPVRAEVVYASDVSLDEMRARLSRNLSNPSDMVIVNYNRGDVGQETMGHISPLGAYHAASDRFLLLDVARYKYPPVWVAAEALYRAMRSTDLIAGKSRGFVLVTPTKEAPGPEGRAKARSPLLILGAIAAVAFILGFGAGTGLSSLRARRRANRAVGSSLS